MAVAFAAILDWTVENKKMVMYSFVSKLNSTFGTIGKATAEMI